jgi:hypothetical protein
MKNIENELVKFDRDTMWFILYGNLHFRIINQVTNQILHPIGNTQRHMSPVTDVIKMKISFK